MPRPSKHVSPDTLGGRIRAAREDLHLSLAEVADGQYSTSLISQIERNKVDPSQDSLRFLAERLKLPFEDLETLAHQHREAENESQHYTSFEDIRSEAFVFLKNHKPQEALSLLERVSFIHVPVFLRWRLIALRGQCYFAQRKFFKAQRDFVYALNEFPKNERVGEEQQQELMLLYLHLASSYRELNFNLDEALEKYQMALWMLNTETPSGYVAEANWGLSLIAFSQANKLPKTARYTDQRQQLLAAALEHAENARIVYRSIGKQIRFATVTCHVARIEKELGNVERVQSYMRDLLCTWQGVLEEPEATEPAEQRLQRDKANIVSAAASTLAAVELEAGEYEEARQYIAQALLAGKRSNKLRLADAYLIYGHILEAQCLHDPAGEEAFRNALQILEDTDRIGARINVHMRLVEHLQKKGEREASEREVENARQLAAQVEASSVTREEDV